MFNTNLCYRYYNNHVLGKRMESQLHLATEKWVIQDWIPRLWDFYSPAGIYHIEQLCISSVYALALLEICVHTCLPNWTVTSSRAETVAYMTHSSSYVLLLKGCLDDNQHVQGNFIHLKIPFRQRRNFGKFLYVHTQSLLDCSPPGSSIYEILLPRILKRVAVSSRASSWPRDQTHFSGVACTCRWILYHWATN